MGEWFDSLSADNKLAAVVGGVIFLYLLAAIFLMWVHGKAEKGGD